MTQLRLDIVPVRTNHNVLRIPLLPRSFITQTSALRLVPQTRRTRRQTTLTLVQFVRRSLLQIPLPSIRLSFQRRRLGSVTAFRAVPELRRIRISVDLGSFEISPGNAAVRLPNPQTVADLGEARPSDRQFRPTFHHQRVAVARTGFGTRQQLPRSDHIDHLLVVVTVVRLQTVTVDLPQNDSVRPNVALRREFPVQYRLGRHPTDGEERFRLDSVVVAAVHVAAEAEVAYLDDEVFGDQAVAGGEVPVDVVIVREVLHALKKARTMSA